MSKPGRKPALYETKSIKPIPFAEDLESRKMAGILRIAIPSRARCSQSAKGSRPAMYKVELVEGDWSMLLYILEQYAEGK